MRETGLSCDGLNLVYSCIKPIPFLTQEIRMAGPYALASRDRPGQCCGRAVEVPQKNVGSRRVELRA